MHGCHCELDYEIGVISFLVDVMVWRSFYLNSCLSVETSFQGFGRMTKGHTEGPVVLFGNLTRKLLWSIGIRWTSESAPQSAFFTVVYPDLGNWADVFLLL